MARSKNNVLLENFSGQLGKTLVIKKYAYGTVLSAYPDMSKVKRSKKQKDNNNLFQDAVAYAQAVLADPKKVKAYKAKLKPGKTVYHAALSEYLNSKKKGSK